MPCMSHDLSSNIFEKSTDNWFNYNFRGDGLTPYVVEPIREFHEPMLDGVHPQPYTGLKQSNDELCQTMDRWYSKSHYLDGLPDEAIDVIVEYTEDFPGPYTMVGILSMGGAVNRVDRSATAFPTAMQRSSSIFGQRGPIRKRMMR